MQLKDWTIRCEHINPELWHIACDLLVQRKLVCSKNIAEIADYAQCKLSLIINLYSAGVFGAETNEAMSVMEGDSVTLHTNLTEILNDDTLLWLFGPNEFVISQITRKNDLTSFFVTDDVRFRGRLQVDQNTGSLTIRNTRIRHSEQYKLRISREKTTTKTFNVTVIGEYSKNIFFISILYQVLWFHTVRFKPHFKTLHILNGAVTLAEILGKLHMEK